MGFVFEGQDPLAADAVEQLHGDAVYELARPAFSKKNQDSGGIANTANRMYFPGPGSFLPCSQSRMSVGLRGKVWPNSSCLILGPNVLGSAFTAETLSLAPAGGELVNLGVNK